MDCRHVLDGMPPVAGDDDAMAPEIERHLEACQVCRERVKARAGAARALGEGLEDLRADPIGPAEMAGLLRDAERLPRRGRRFPGAVAAAILVAVTGLAALIYLRPDPALFAAGPQVAGAEDVEVRPPPLRVPRSPSWDAEPYRALLTVTADGSTMRLSYEPEDGSETVRRFAPGEWSGPPRPQGAPESALVAVLLASDPSTPWVAATRVLRNRVLVVLYLAGLEEGGTLGAVEAGVPKSRGERTALREIERLGAAVTPRDMAGGFPDGRVLQFRITRGDGGTRFRYGLYPETVPGSARFGLGDDFRTDDDLSGPGEDLALPGLHDWVVRAEPGRERSLSFLEAGTGVRYLDVLRAVESGQGSWFLPAVFSHSLGPRFELPGPLGAADAAILSETGGGASRIIVTILDDGNLSVRGMRRSTADLDLGAPGSEICIRASRETAFSAWREVLDRAREGDRAVRMVFAPEDPEIPWERTATVPFRTGLPSSVTVELSAGPDGEVTWTEPADRLDADTEVRVVVLADLTAGQVLPVVLRLVRLGATSVRFD